MQPCSALLRRAQYESKRPAFTMVELLVVLAILGILLALALPAIQQARESARQVQCLNNLHQHSVAAAGFVEVHGHFPAEEALVGQVGPYGEYVEESREVWSCPSDGRADASSGNYMFNDGTGFREPARNGLFDELFGSRRSRPPGVSPEDVVDGLSQTACISERLVALPSDVSLSESELASEPLRYLWYVPQGYSDLDEFLQACRCERTTQTPFNFPSNDYFVGYDHNLPPNTPGCQNIDAASLSPKSSPEFLTPAITATSHHPGHVNVVMCDGSGRRVSDSIDLNVWRALGTRNGREVSAW